MSICFITMKYSFCYLPVVSAPPLLWVKGYKSFVATQFIKSKCANIFRATFARNWYLWLNVLLIKLKLNNKKKIISFGAQPSFSTPLFVFSARPCEVAELN